MKSDRVTTAIRDYLFLIETGLETEQANIAALSEVLDRLALAQHHLAPTFEEHPDAPRPESPRLAELAADRFPSFGFYNVPNPVTEHLGEPEITLGWALDDVVDIARDLWSVRWYLDNASKNDALHEFVESYRLHWGRHLRHLQFYMQGRLDD